MTQQFEIPERKFEIAEKGYAIGGRLIGAKWPVFVRLNNVEIMKVWPQDLIFQFSTRYLEGTEYKITIAYLNGNDGESCKIINGQGVISNHNIDDIIITFE